MLHRVLISTPELNIALTKADSSITNIQNMSALKTVNISGDKGLTTGVTTGNTALESINSTATGNIDLTLPDQAMTVNLGAGNDTLRGVVNTDAVVNLGAGNDTLSVTTLNGSVDGGDGEDTYILTSATISTAQNTAFAKLSNFEVLGTSATAAVTIDYDKIDANSIKLTGIGTAKASANLMENTDSLMIAANRTGAAGTAGAAGDPGSAGSDGDNAVAITQTTGNNTATVKFVNAVTLSGGAGGNGGNAQSANNNGGDGGDGAAALSAAATSSLNIVLISDNTTADTVTFTDGAGGTGMGTGSAGTAGGAGAGLSVKDGGTVTITDEVQGSAKYSNLALNKVEGATTIDGSAMHGSLTAEASATGATILGGSGKDTLKGGSGADTLNGGAGDDTIHSKDGADLLTGGAGKDTFVFAGGEGSVTEQAIITDAGSGDILQFTSLAGTQTFEKDQVTVSGQETLQSYLDAAAHDSAGNTNGNVAWFQYQGNTYVVADYSAATTFQDASDVVVKLQGLVDLSEATISGINLILA